MTFPSFALAQMDSSKSLDTTVVPAVAPAVAPAAKSLSKHSIQPSLGLTLQSVTEGDSDLVSAVWVAGLDGGYFYDGEPWQLGAKLHAIYGEQVANGKYPIKTQDDLIASITPSMTVIPGPQIRLFFETAAETQMASGIASDSSPTKFLDPVFIYQSLFLGRRFESAAEDGSWQYDLTAGVGYALQETLAQSFIFAQNRNVVVTENNPLSSVQNEITLESGYSAIVDFNLQENVNDNFQWTASWKTVAINRIAGPSLPEASNFFQNARITSLLITGLQYKFLSLSYTGELTYDRNVSLRRSLDQSLVFGFKATL
ncbi:MAG TPA: hypothetical protein VGM92_15630 [Candidatus Kapabacteria bacterium]